MRFRGARRGHRYGAYMHSRDIPQKVSPPTTAWPISCMRSRGSSFNSPASDQSHKISALVDSETTKLDSSLSDPSDDVSNANTGKRERKPKRILALNFWLTLALLITIFCAFSPSIASFRPHAMFSAVNRPATVRWASLVTSKRHLFFSSRSHGGTSWNQAGNGEGSGSGSSSGSGNDAGNSRNGGGADSAATAASTHNYDSASLERLDLYSVAVAFAPKKREESNIFRKRKQMSSGKVEGGSAAVKSPTGEDNLFISMQAADGSLALGVADGVGGWADAGYDSSAISRELCHFMKTGFENAAPKDPADVSPLSLLDNAFNAVQQSPDVEIGGTTACVGILTRDHRLKVANLGDSWCGVFRDYKLVNETSFQTHNFNTPYQLAKIPAQIRRDAEMQGKRYIIDSPQMADQYEWKLEKNDIVVFATDGVTDNVVPADIEIYLRDSFDKKTPLREVASGLVRETVKVSKDPNYPSAFAQELSRLTGQRYLGGKEDDITVVMVQVR